MVIEVGIELVNSRSVEVVINLPAGTIFEVDNRTDQNVATSQTYRFVIPPHSRLITQVSGVCLNRDLSPPSSTRGRLTPFRYEGSTSDQYAVWDTVSNPLGA